MENSKLEVVSTPVESSIDPLTDYTQENRSLSELLSDQAAISILGEQISFELDFLLINPLGYKLRHGGAHGGISDKEFYGDGIKIIWWVIIKLLLELK